MEPKITIGVEISGLDDLKLQTQEVIKKTEELEQAVQRLNECELTIELAN